MTPPTGTMASNRIQQLNALLNNPRYRTLLSLVKAFRNGLMYGVKIRFPHSLVMTFLFHEGSLKEKFRFILTATAQHAKNLAFFALVYKSISLLLNKLRGSTHPVHNFIGGLMGGYLVFGTNNKVNMQINLYLLSRVTIGLARLAVKKQLIPEPQFNTFPLFAAIVWGLALTLFEYHTDVLQPSLQNSMTYLYRDSTVWSNIADFLFYSSAELW
ncbi:PREDICTED: peroxisomal membrane protein 4-like [Amphimedon queenslandica]|uniref:Peroxisomal membrane protein 4 n=1 Tax=Amphimedon queenslandica TaxID=400682 RepID=A0A1X7VB14_AMPQE|nr:PREDICTED: peroxisomal membrane protein 4-like [Amphimedon queenslandica]|eukprot:XP_003384961.2 PREDICTED: peroxisomal membrane protein 4-like [Amphimedon queenslandica]